MNGLKEWATVVKALELGKQTVILRKGGILETASGFNIESKEFLLFPTWEHQEEIFVKLEFQNFLNEVLKEKPEKGFNRITSYAKVLDEKDIDSIETIDALSPFHVWSDTYIKERMNWLPEKPMKAVFLQVFNIEELKIPLKDEFQGCKSWVEINSDIKSEKSVLSNSEIESKLKEFKEIVN